jgi:hypothetical protein
MLLLTLPLFSATDCNKKKTGGDLPDCISKIIEAPQKQKLDKSPVQVDEYTYKGKRAFLLTAPCCDQYNMLYDENCNYLCSPSGGYTGKGDEKCPDFKDAEFVRLVWKRDQ